MFEGSPIPESSPLEKAERHWKEKVRKIFRIWSVSALMTFGTSEANAQTNHNDNTDTSTVKSWQPSEVPVNSGYRISIEGQKAWLMSYIHSPKYKERMSKEFIRSQELKSDGVKPLVLAEEKITSSTNSSSIDSLNINVLFPEPDISKLNKKQLKIIQKAVERRYNRVRTGEYGVVDSIPSESGHTYGEFILNTPYVVLTPNLPDEYVTTPVHEFGHQSTNGEEDMDDITKQVLTKHADASKYIIEYADYLKNPTEIYARLCALRYLLASYTEYNPSTQSFTEEDFEKIKSTPEIMKNVNVGHLLDLFQKDELIWMLNNIADASDNKDEVLTVA